MNALLIFLGAGLGGICRYWVWNSVHAYLSRQFPYGTLVVNASGCFFVGLLFVIVLERYNTLEPQLRSLLFIGFLGGYTTFSTFSIETLGLLERGVGESVFKYYYQRKCMSYPYLVRDVGW